MLHPRKSRTRNVVTGLALSSLLFLGVACTVEKTEEGQLPEYKVEKTQEGNLPKYDVDPAEVEVGTQEKTITVPDVDIKAPDEDDDADDGGSMDDSTPDDGGSSS